MTSLRGVLFAAILGLAAVAPAVAGQFSPEQTTEIQAIIKDYLIKNPEVLRDAITALDAKEKAAEAETRAKALARLSGEIAGGPDGFAVGNPDGKITLVEFFDYNCGYCRRSIPDVARLMKDNPDLKVVLRDFPILSPASVDAAIIAGAAHRQLSADKFWDFHKSLLGSHGLVGKEQAMASAKALGVDMAKLEKDAADPKVRAAIQHTDSMAKDLNLNGTPTFVIGGDVEVGAVGYDQLQADITNIRKCGKALCS
jgi:protein-disulfide isomerase